MCSLTKKFGGSTCKTEKFLYFLPKNTLIKTLPGLKKAQKCEKSDVLFFHLSEKEPWA